MVRRTVAMLGVALATCLPLAADDEVHEERVEFEAGETGASVEGSIVGYGTAQYTLGAAKGQTMSVELVGERRIGESTLGFDSIKGTVLVGASSEIEPGDPDRVLEPDEDVDVIWLNLHCRAMGSFLGSGPCHLAVGRVSGGKNT